MQQHLQAAGAPLPTGGRRRSPSLVSLLPALPKPVPHAGRRCAVGGRTRVRQWLTGRAGCASLTVRHLDVIHRLCSLFGKLLSCKVSLPVMNPLTVQHLLDRLPQRLQRVTVNVVKPVHLRLLIRRSAADKTSSSGHRRTFQSAAAAAAAAAAPPPPPGAAVGGSSGGGGSGGGSSGGLLRRPAAARGV